MAVTGLGPAKSGMELLDDAEVQLRQVRFLQSCWRA